jgi:hypothetical protein
MAAERERLSPAPGSADFFRAPSPYGSLEERLVHLDLADFPSARQTNTRGRPLPPQAGVRPDPERPMVPVDPSVRSGEGPDAGAVARVP